MGHNITAQAALADHTDLLLNSRPVFLMNFSMFYILKTKTRAACINTEYKKTLPSSSKIKQKVLFMLF
jgi:hypothetical protein